MEGKKTSGAGRHMNWFVLVLVGIVGYFSYTFVSQQLHLNAIDQDYAAAVFHQVFLRRPFPMRPHFLAVFHGRAYRFQAPCRLYDLSVDFLYVAVAEGHHFFRPLPLSGL